MEGIWSLVGAALAKGVHRLLSGQDHRLPFCPAPAALRTTLKSSPRTAGAHLALGVVRGRVLLLDTRTPLGVMQVTEASQRVLAARELKVYVGEPTVGEVTAATFEGDWGLSWKMYCSAGSGGRCGA